MQFFFYYVDEIVMAEKAKRTPGFQKGNDLWRKGVKARKMNQKKADEFYRYQISGALGLYFEELEKMVSEGYKPSEAKLLAMEKIEKLFPYGLPKRAPVDHKGDTVLPIPILTDVSTNDSNKKAPRAKKKN